MYARIGGRAPDMLKKLAALQEELGRPKDAAATLEKLNYIYPVNDEELHRKLGGLWFGLGDFRRAAREYRAVVASKPIDKAAAHYNLARAYWSLKDTGNTEEQLLEALEAAPGFRPAQKLQIGRAHV